MSIVENIVYYMDLGVLLTGAVFLGVGLWKNIKWCLWFGVGVVSASVILGVPDFIAGMLKALNEGCC